MSEPASLQVLVDLLRRCLKTSGSAERQHLIRQFQEPIWESEAPVGDERLDEILRTAAYVLDFYEPRDESRAEDHSYFGDAELEIELRSILRSLGQEEVHDA